MADKIKIKKGNQSLTVSVKAFETVYKPKGFEAAGKVKHDDGDGESKDGGAGNPKSEKTTARTGKKKASKKQARAAKTKTPSTDETGHAAGETVASET